MHLQPRLQAGAVECVVARHAHAHAPDLEAVMAYQALVMPEPVQVFCRECLDRQLVDGRLRVCCAQGLTFVLLKVSNICPGTWGPALVLCHVQPIR